VIATAARYSTGFATGSACGRLILRGRVDEGHFNNGRVLGVHEQVGDLATFVLGRGVGLDPWRRVGW
jgi:hypothetical protein